MRMGTWDADGDGVRMRMALGWHCYVVMAWDGGNVCSLQF